MPGRGNKATETTIPRSTRVAHYGHPDASLRNECQTSLERLQVYRATMGQPSSVSVEMDPQDKKLVQYLARKSFHLPGNTWCEDWWQFMWNNHPIFGICFHHPRHPIKACTRVVALIGNLMLGLALTNMFYLFLLWNPQLNQSVFSVTAGGVEWTLTTGMFLLWTVGGAIHAIFNVLQWNIAACACCRTGGFCERVACCPSLGKQLLRVFVLIILVLAILLMLMRIAVTNAEEEDSVDSIFSNSTLGIAPPTSAPTSLEDVDGWNGIRFFGGDDSLELEVHDVEEFQFLVGYAVEMFLALFIYFPILGTILLSGCIGCGKVPILGGRPYEVAAENRRAQKDSDRLSKTNSSSSGCSPRCPDAILVEHWGGDDAMEVVLATPVENSSHK
eukprot:Nitzschia sp. Nitz4//scaffold47_size129522//29894//31057//NITZ4_003543-RA/size129522-processed-gene-0.6-mRNA-1//1//CDS//3329552776//735//frame0